MMRSARITLSDSNEKLAWQLSGALLAGLLVIWLTGLWLHSAEPPVPTTTNAPQVLRPDAQRPVAVRTILFVPAGSNTIARDADTGVVIRTLEFQADGFVSALVKSLDRDRSRMQLPLDQPYRIVKWDNGQTLLEDPATGQQIELSAFGQTNVAAFNALLDEKKN